MSIDMMEFVMEIEHAFAVTIPDDEFITQRRKEVRTAEVYG